MRLLIHMTLPCLHTHTVVQQEEGHYMHPQSLYCTAYVSRGPDSRFEEEWHEQMMEQEKLNIDYVYWTKEVAAVSVSLSPSQEKFLTPEYTPHVPLAKQSHQQWQDLGPCLQCHLGLLDFRPVAGDPRTEYSACGYVWRTALTHKVPVYRPVELRVEERQCTELFPLVEEIPELSLVPPPLWATHKYYVGLIRGAAPLVVHAKSDHRPCLRQYPLKQEAIDGIEPVFESLLKSGIIIPCTYFQSKKSVMKDSPLNGDSYKICKQ